MEITKEKVLEKAKELGLTLTDEQTEQYVKDGKLPEKETDKLDKISNEEAIRIIKEMRDENAKRRLNEKKLQDKLDDIAKDKAKQKEDDLKENGKWQDLANQYQARIAELEPEYNEYQDYKKVKREQFKTQLGDRWIPTFEKAPLTELEALAGKLITPKVEPNSSNHKGDKPDGNKPLINYTSMK